MAITFEQALTADRFHEDGCTETVGPRGGVTRKVVEWRRNGATKTWKTRPGEFRIPVKYGMYAYAYIDDYSAGRFHVESDCPLRKVDALMMSNDVETEMNVCATCDKLVDDNHAPEWLRTDGTWTHDENDPEIMT